VITSLIPQDSIDLYDLDILAHNGRIYIEIRKGIYSLPHAGVIANDLLQERLKVDGYYPCKHTPVLWKHTQHMVVFVLVVDDFGIKYTGEHNTRHLLDALKRHYTIT
jgi:hypothetical protein